MRQAAAEAVSADSVEAHPLSGENGGSGVNVKVRVVRGWVIGLGPVRRASALAPETKDGTISRAVGPPIALTHTQHIDACLQIVPGDYAPLMARVVKHLEEAKAHAANAEQEVGGW